MSRKISVVIPTYKRFSLLSGCLAALGKQHMNAGDYEIIVVSDGPDEQTRHAVTEMKKSLPCYITYVELLKNAGPACARNRGWREAEGTLILFTDDDCRPGPSWVSSMCKAFEESNYGSEIAFSGRVIVPLPENPTDYERNTANLETADFITANCACTKTALEKVGGFDERFPVAWREDSDLEFRLLENNIPVLKVEGAIVVHPVRKTRWGISIREQRKTMFNALLYKKYPVLFRKKIQPAPAWDYYIIVAGCIMVIAGSFIDNKTITITGGIIYLVLTTAFIIKRLANTSKNFRHVLEMIITSMVIPFASVYWTLYGSFKYRVLYY